MKNEKSSKIISFSILMPNYNKAEYIEEAIESVKSQTYPYWELIIVDDASTDKSIEKIMPFLEDKRIKLIIHRKNRGAGQAVKTAIAKSANYIIGILDSDDKLHIKALEIIAKAYKQYPEYGFIYSTHWECDSKLLNPQVSKVIGSVDPNYTNLFSIKTSHFKTFRKDIYEKTEGFNPKLKICYDIDIIFKLEEVTRLKFINKPLYYYRNYEGGFSKKKKFQVQFEYYISKLNAYYRRLNTNIPNLNLIDLYVIYYETLFYKLIHFLAQIVKFLKITILIKFINNKFSGIHLKLKYKFNILRFKKKFFFWIENFIGYIKQD